MAVVLPFGRRGAADEREAAIASSLLNLADAHGLYSGLYLHFGHSRGGPVRAITSTAAARSHYLELIAASSLAVKAQVAHRPFAWSSDDVRFARHPDKPHAGIAVPVQDHVNGPGLVALIGIGLDAVQAVVLEKGPALSWAATDIHMAALAVLRGGQIATPTAREMACLRMAAEGMTVAAIGRSLGIAGRTVEFHLRNVVEKLGATSKVNAVAIAASRGLLHCEPVAASRDPAA